MATPHINAEMGDFADVVLMPGDPLRAKYIAETFLEGAVEVNNVRGMLGFTGTYKGRRISVMGHGMGIPSCSIYARELIAEFGVKKIIRVGSCGAVRDDIKLRDVVIGNAAHTNSQVATLQAPGLSLSLAASYPMLRGAVEAAEAAGLNARVGAVFSSDFFYTTRPEVTEGLIKVGTLGVEMEAAGLYGCAMAEGKEALAVLTVSDHLTKDGTDMSAAQRETSFSSALEIAAAALTA